MARVVRVLCVHEDRLRINTRRRILENCGFNVSWSANGLDGLIQFRFFVPDLVVIDYDLPDISGDVIAAGMKKINARIPVLMFAPHIFLPPSAIANVDVCLIKGDSPELLLARINELLGNSTAMAA
ncbi:MAG: response regulator receiver protein [Acidobacteriales bacterium]|nr:response regulator receiver protein [Terriglobales bacterium]